MFHQKRIRQPGPTERAVDLHLQSDLAVTFDCVDDLKNDINGEDFLAGPCFDCSDAAELTPDIIDDGMIGEAGLQSGGITGIDCLNVSINGLGSFIACTSSTA